MGAAFAFEDHLDDNCHFAPELGGRKNRNVAFYDPAFPKPFEAFLHGRRGEAYLVANRVGGHAGIALHESQDFEIFVIHTPILISKTRFENEIRHVAANFEVFHSGMGVVSYVTVKKE